jgi:hypothetical protein
MPAQPPGTEVEVDAVTLPEPDELDDEELEDEMPEQFVVPLRPVTHSPVTPELEEDEDDDEELDEPELEQVMPPLLVG